MDFLDFLNVKLLNQLVFRLNEAAGICRAVGRSGNPGGPTALYSVRPVRPARPRPYLDFSRNVSIGLSYLLAD